MSSTMKVIQVTIDEPLLVELDKAAQCDGKPRSVLVREAVAKMLRKRHFEEAERRVIESYRNEPQDLEEIEAWATIQDWGDE